MNKCIYDDCKHYQLLDDGEDVNGIPYPPNPYCDAAERFLDEDWMGDQECVAPNKKSREEV